MWSCKVGNTRTSVVRQISWTANNIRSRPPQKPQSKQPVLSQRHVAGETHQRHTPERCSIASDVIPLCMCSLCTASVWLNKLHCTSTDTVVEAQSVRFRHVSLVRRQRRVGVIILLSKQPRQAMLGWAMSSRPAPGRHLDWYRILRNK